MRHCGPASTTVAPLWTSCLACLVCILVLAADAASQPHRAGRKMMFVSEVTRFEGPRGGVRGVVFSPDGRRILFSTGKTMRLWEVKSHKELRCFSGYKRQPNLGAFLPGGRQVISIDTDGQVRVHEIQTGKELHHFRAYSSHGDHLLVSPDGRFFITSGGDYKTARMIDVVCRVKLWQREPRKELRRFEGHTSFVQCIALSPDGKHLLTGAGHLDGNRKPVDCTIRLWDVSTGKELRRFEGHTDTVGSLAFSPTGRYAVSGGWDHTVRLWDLATGKEVRTLLGHEEAVWSVAYSPDGKYVISGAGTTDDFRSGKKVRIVHAGCTLGIWETSTGRELLSLGHPRPVRTVAFSPDGRAIISGSDDGVVRLYFLQECPKR